MAKILVVDDEDYIREMLSSALEGEGHSVTLATNGKQAEAMYDESIDLVITDIIMPEQEGIETILQLKKRNPRVRVIAISGGGRVNSKDYLELARKLGAVHTFSKPLDIEEFLAAVNTSVE